MNLDVLEAAGLSVLLVAAVFVIVVVDIRRHPRRRRPGAATRADRPGAHHPCPAPSDTLGDPSVHTHTRIEP